MSEQTTVSIEDQLLDAQMHVGRLENELALALKGIAPQLRWSTMRPAMSGVYFNTSDERMSDPTRWGVINVTADGEWLGRQGIQIGEFWVGPLEIGGPE